MPANVQLTDVQQLKDMLVDIATGNYGGDNQFYQTMRFRLLRDPSIKHIVPPFVATCRSINDFWDFIKPAYDSYKGRRAFLREAFEPLLALLEASDITPGDAPIGEALSAVDWDYVQSDWRKAIDRRASDPSGAITAARTLLETVCKHILDEVGNTYSDKDDLPKLYSTAAKELRLSPGDHVEQVFRQILGGCQAVVEGLGTLRNRLSDSHGTGRTASKPSPRHAELAVNLAGAMASFMIETWEARKAERMGFAERTKSGVW